jgi:hypothetical protein
VGAGSDTLRLVVQNWTVGSLSRIVTTVVAGVPTLAPKVESKLTGFVRERTTVSAGSGTLSSIARRSKLWEADPAGKVRVPLPPTMESEPCVAVPPVTA